MPQAETLAKARMQELKPDWSAPLENGKSLTGAVLWGWSLR